VRRHFLDNLSRFTRTTEMVDGDVCTDAGKGDRDGAADAGSGAGYQSGLAFEGYRCHLLGTLKFTQAKSHHEDTKDTKKHEENLEHE
jgi:hypothetical protein